MCNHRRGPIVLRTIAAHPSSLPAGELQLLGSPDLQCVPPIRQGAVLRVPAELLMGRSVSALELTPRTKELLTAAAEAGVDLLLMDPLAPPLSVEDLVVLGAQSSHMADAGHSLGES
jgi:hypothetical protein